MKIHKIYLFFNIPNIDDLKIRKNINNIFIVITLIYSIFFNTVRICLAGISEQIFKY